ncbi:hypothetical protein EVAR_1034_1 [Eumeta japonica]|uniref:Uncharacterized protein n=1 Tax=Eumeta variegata TaxID=151549 RepID=A0A4C1SF56_EUMVA|nr:hypothetical protein EVAR_1034_1 [Eumeta japonica]
MAEGRAMMMMTMMILMVEVIYRGTRILIIGLHLGPRAYIAMVIFLNLNSGNDVPPKRVGTHWCSPALTFRAADTFCRHPSPSRPHTHLVNQREFPLAPHSV